MDPSAFDLQVNGYGGVDFNSPDLTPEALHAACALLKTHGVGGILATITTDHAPVMKACLSNLSRYRAADPLACAMIAGIHIEGPFLNQSPGYRGAHPADAIVPANLELTRRLLDAAGGLTRIVTLAPESDPQLSVTRWLAAQGVCVSAGHTDASVDQLKAAIDAGLSMFTHLGNGCPMHGMHRHDNIIQRALSLSDRLWCCFIADGVHVPWVALGNYLKCVGMERAIVVTDCMAAAGLGGGQYRLARWDIAVGDDRVARSPDGSHLVGSAITMPETRRNLLEKLKLSPDEVQRLIDVNPRRAINVLKE